MWYSISIFVLLIENGTYLFISLSPPLSYNLLKIEAYILLIFLSPTISIDIDRDPPPKKKTHKKPLHSPLAVAEAAYDAWKGSSHCEPLWRNTHPLTGAEPNAGKNLGPWWRHGATEFTGAGLLVTQMSFPYGLVQSGQNLCFFACQCHLDNMLLPGLVNVGSPRFLFRETGRASARNIVGGVPALCGKCRRAFPTLEFSAPALCRDELCAAPGRSSPGRWQAVGGSRSRAWRATSWRASWWFHYSPAALAASHNLSETQFSYPQNGDKSSPYLRIRIK